MAIINEVDVQKYSRQALDIACRSRNARFVAEVNVPFNKNKRIFSSGIV